MTLTYRYKYPTDKYTNISHYYYPTCKYTNNKLQLPNL